MASMAELQVRLTGGASNSVIANSIGGVVSSVQVLSQTATGLTTLTGVTIPNAMGNAVGLGTLSYTATGTTITWTPFNGTTGTPVNIGVDGTYFVQGGSNGGAVVLTVVAASLPGSATSNNITIADVSNAMFADVTKDQSDSGLSVYHCFSLKNTGTDQKKSVTIWIDTACPGQDNVSIGVAVAVAGDGATTGLETAPANENTAPVTVVFSAPTSQATGLSIGTLSGSGGSTYQRCFWVKHLIPAGVTVAYPNDFFRIGISAKV